VSENKNRFESYSQETSGGFEFLGIETGTPFSMFSMGTGI
jgi:hypothetical protein